MSQATSRFSATTAAFARAREQRISRWGAMLFGLVFAIILPYIVTSVTWQHDFVEILIFIGFALGLNIVVGFAGLLDLGYLAFYAVGAYVVGYFSSEFLTKAGKVHFLVSGPGFESNLSHTALGGLHFNFFLVLIIAGVVAALAGVIIGLPTLRLRGDYIAIVTLAFGEIIRVFAINGDSIKIGNFQLSNGNDGISLDPIWIPGLGTFRPSGDVFTGQPNNKPFYWIILAIVVIVLFVSFRLRDSRLGRAWIALREDEVAAASMGVPLVKTKLLAYATGAAIGGVVGAFQGYFNGTVRSGNFEFSFSILVLAMVILGGLGSIWGVVCGAILVKLIDIRLIPDLGLSKYTFGIFGFLLVFIMIVRPQGLIPESRRKQELTEGTESDEALYEVRA
jgi:branched-chain amino acid transport system permease protein